MRTSHLLKVQCIGNRSIWSVCIRLPSQNVQVSSTTFSNQLFSISILTIEIIRKILNWMLKSYCVCHADLLTPKFSEYKLQFVHCIYVWVIYISMITSFLHPRLRICIILWIEYRFRKCFSYLNMCITKYSNSSRKWALTEINPTSWQKDATRSICVMDCCLGLFCNKDLFLS